jgi:hypothetical protein
MSLGGARGRLKRLEERRGPCPDCSPFVGVEVVHAGDTRPDSTPEPCARCGNVPQVVRIIETVVDEHGNEIPWPPAPA